MKATGKQISSKRTQFVRGGSTGMSHEQHTGAQKPGVSGVSKTSTGGFAAKGGSGKMSGKQAVTAAKGGHSGKLSGGRKRGYGGDEHGDAY